MAGKHYPPVVSPEDNPLYHDTYKLLRCYRDSTYSLKVAVRQVEIQFQLEYKTSIDEFLDSIYTAGADLTGSQILLSPKDLFNIAKKFQITPKDAFEQYCETYIGANSRFPIVRLKPRGSVQRCPLLKDRKCLVHDVKPAVCAMFPIGRYLALPDDGHFPKNVEEMSVGYVFTDPDCGDATETHTVQEWFRNFNIPLKDDYFFTWTKTRATLCRHLHLLEKNVPDKIMLRIWNAILISLYLNYEITEDFQAQFQQNSDAILSLIETLRTVDVLMSNKN